MKTGCSLNIKVKNIANFLLRSKMARLIVIILLIYLLVKSCNPDTFEAVEPETQVHYQLKRFGTYARLYISRTDTFGSDYIEFNHTAIFFPEIYYVEPDTLYFIDKGSFYLRDVECDRFVIKTIDKISSPGIGPGSTREDVLKLKREAEQSDSIRKVFKAKPHYKIRIVDYATGFVIYNPEGEETVSEMNSFIFRGS